MKCKFWSHRGSCLFTDVLDPSVASPRPSNVRGMLEALQRSIDFLASEGTAIPGEPAPIAVAINDGAAPSTSSSSFKRYVRELNGFDSEALTLVTLKRPMLPSNAKTMAEEAFIVCITRQWKPILGKR